MVVIADHSIAHPAFMKRHLGPEYAEAGLPFTFGPEDPLWTGVLQACDEADIVLVSSDFVKGTFVEAGMSPDKIKVAYLGVRSDFQGLKRDYSLPPRLRLVFTGGFGLRKGAKYILQALQLLDRAGVDYEFTIAGATTEAGRLFEQMPVAGTIRLLGHIPQDDLRGLLAESDIYLFPSLAEGFSSSLFEAMSAGLPVITTIESTARIRDGVEGCVVPSKNAAAIAEKIVWLRGNPDKLESIGRAAAKLVRDRYTWNHYADDVVRVYESAMDRLGEPDRA
jgi:glycosyltransferase involved in cell wall biosynthesis